MKLPSASKIVIITDDTVKALYGLDLQKELQAELISFPAGEASKNQATKTQLDHQLLELGADRNSLIIALGGGVVGDLAGYVASTFMRGIRWINIPTTLLAMVDSSIGGKTGINTPHGKNLIGHFWPATQTHIELKYLDTLSQDQINNGLVEAIKIFLTHDAQAFNTTEEDPQNLSFIIQKARELKVAVTQRDPHEQGERSTLNFGHTFGHAIEKASHYQIEHGKAVGLGILVEAELAAMAGHLEEEELKRIQSLLAKLNIQKSELKSFQLEELLEQMHFDKKNKDFKIHFVMLSGIGAVHHDGSWTQPLNLDHARKLFRTSL